MPDGTGKRWSECKGICWLMEEIQSIDNFPYEDIKILDKYPVDVSRQVLKVLIDNSSLGQNYGPIELGRKKIGEIVNREWLIQNFMKVADESINYSDEWEYRRLVELVDLYIPELKEKVLEKGINSDNEEIREVAEDFQIHI